MSSQISLEALGQICLLQNALLIPRDEKTLAEMVCATFVKLPGIDKACIYLDKQKISSASRSSADAFSLPKQLPAANKLNQECPNALTLQLRTVKKVYGALVINVIDSKLLDPYKPHIENTVNFISLIIENKKQEEQLIQTNQFLEAEVARRTAELSLSEQRLNIAMKGAKCGLWDFYYQANELYFNPSYFTMAGYEPDEFPHNYEEWRKRIHPDDVANAEKQAQDFITGKTTDYTIEFRFKTKSGDWMWILSQGEIFERDENNQPVRITGLHIDISSRKEIEAELKKHQENLNEMVDEKTEQLQRTMKLMVGREVRMVELKGMISKLQQQLREENIKPLVDESFGD